MKKENCVTIYGCGSLGMSLLSELPACARNVNLYKYSFGKPKMTKKDCYFHGNNVSIVGSDYLVHANARMDLRNNVSCIIVTLTGEQLNEEIDFLLNLNIPLIICSTKYNIGLINRKIYCEEVPILISDNFALPIVDFWNRIENMDRLPESCNSKVHIIESHQSGKKDVSGTAIHVLKLLIDKGFSGELPDQKDYVIGKSSSSGSIVSIRGEDASLKYGVPKEFINGHAYHKITFYLFSYELARKYYDYFESLNNYSQEGVIEFKVSLENRTIEILHNINGREIYSDGVFTALEFLKTNPRVSSAIDLL